VGVNDNIEDERCILKIFIAVTRRVKGILDSSESMLQKEAFPTP